MAEKTDYQWMLEQYPDVIHKEQFYQICHISKRTALLLLETGIVPCLKTGKKTRQYSILTKDVVAFLEDRERNPEKYKLPEGSYSKDRRKQQSRADRTIPPWLLGNRAKRFYRALLKPYPDVLSMVQVVEATGYNHKTIHKWCGDNHLLHFVINGKFQIPKISLLEFMLSDRFAGVHYKTSKQSAKLLSLLAKFNILLEEDVLPDEETV